MFQTKFECSELADPDPDLTPEPNFQRIAISNFLTNPRRIFENLYSIIEKIRHTQFLYSVCIFHPVLIGDSAPDPEPRFTGAMRIRAGVRSPN
jgi:hypothetical protein